MSPIKIYCDGGARGNPGPAAAAFVVEDAEKVIHEGSLYLGKSTNNEAEYQAILLALKWLTSNKKILKPDSIEFYLDSELATIQLKGDYKIKSKNLVVLVTQVKAFEEKLKTKVNYTFIPRQKNRRADFLVNQTLNKVTKDL